MLGIYLAIIETNEHKSLFERLYNEYKHIMYNVAYQILNDVQHSEDAVHDAFLSVAKNIEKIPNENSLQTRNFLIIIVKNSALKIYNKNKKELPFDEKIFDMVNLEDQKNMFCFIKELDSKYGDVIILKYFYGYHDKEIADILGITRENVKIRLHRGKALLKKKLLEKDYDRYSI